MKKIISKLFVTFAFVFLCVFTLASCGEDEVKPYTGTAQGLVDLIILPEDRTTVAGDFTVPATVAHGNEKFDVTWTSNNTELLKFEASTEDASRVVAKVTLPTDETKTVDFRATVSCNDTTGSKDFKIRIKKYSDPKETFYSFYDNASKGESYNLSGWILALEAYNTQYSSASIYLLDESLEGAYYCYSVKMSLDFYNGLKIGSPVTVSVTSTVYNGLIETKSSGSIVANKDLAAKTEAEMLAAKDISDIFITADSKKITYAQSSYVKLTHMKVTKISGVKLDSTSTTHSFITLERNGETVSVALNKNLMALDSQAAKDLDAEVKKLKEGDYVDVEGLVGWYNGIQLLATKATIFTASTAADDSGVVKVDAPVTPKPEPEKPTYPAGTIGLDVTSLGLTNSYGNGSKEVGGVSFSWTEIGNFGNGIQMRSKDGKISSICNTTAFSKKIAKIVLTYNAEKSTYDSEVLTFTFGTAADALTSEVKLSSAAGTKTYTVTPEGDFTFFQLKYSAEKGSQYWDSIVIYFVD
ncbi:MAG: hypothetical protein K2K15_05445 [Anaeroplasmataceae bacterium]|nr:hypothetical protein [Anaeroplasmataceae bacterium]